MPLSVSADRARAESCLTYIGLQQWSGQTDYSLRASSPAPRVLPPTRHALADISRLLRTKQAVLRQCTWVDHEAWVLRPATARQHDILRLEHMLICLAQLPKTAAHRAAAACRAAASPHCPEQSMRVLHLGSAPFSCPFSSQSRGADGSGPSAMPAGPKTGRWLGMGQ